MIAYIAYSLGVVGTWLLADCLISIRLYLNSKDETGKRIQSWKYDHSVRVLRGILGAYLIVIGGLMI